MDGVDQQAWKDPLILRTEGQWSGEMSCVNNGRHLHREPCRPALSDVFNLTFFKILLSGTFLYLLGFAFTSRSTGV